jgi:NADPH-dependent 2,4-dienoyl-CoA reductase/sulfur reductase-like enzyme
LASCKGANAVNLSKTRVVIVGAGQAGGRAAEALRAAGHVGPITLIGEEAHLPYERPQLSKSILLDSEPNPTFIRAPDANIQIVGHPGGGDEIIREDVANGVGGVTVNAARDMSVLRRLVASRKTAHRIDLENPAFELKRSLVS